MIEKIIHIKNIGKFANYCSQGDMSFRPITLVYAENARGKTTLTSILRSLYTNDGRLVHERKTVGCADAPSVQLRVSEATITAQRFESAKTLWKQAGYVGGNFIRYLIIMAYWL